MIEEKQVLVPESLLKKCLYLVYEGSDNLSMEELESLITQLMELSGAFYRKNGGINYYQ